MGMIKLDSKGFSLIEVMIGAGLLAMLALGFSMMMTNQQKAQGVVSAKNAFTQIGQSIAAASADTNAGLKTANLQVPGGLRYDVAADAAALGTTGTAVGTSGTTTGTSSTSSSF